MKSAVVHIVQLSGVLVVAAMGGAARALSEWGAGRRYTAARAAAEIFLAVFAGLVVHWIAEDIAMPEGARTAMVALAGYSSRAILETLNASLLKWARREGGR